MPTIILRPYFAPYRAGHGPSAVAYHDLKCPRSPYIGKTLLALGKTKKATLNVQFRRLRVLSSAAIPISNIVSSARILSIPYVKPATLLAYSPSPSESHLVSFNYTAEPVTSKARNCTALPGLKGLHLAKVNPGQYPSSVLNPSNLISI